MQDVLPRRIEMKTMIGIAALFVLTASVLSAAQPKAVILAKQVIARENERLTKAAKSTRAFMATMLLILNCRLRSGRHSVPFTWE